MQISFHLLRLLQIILLCQGKTNRRTDERKQSCIDLTNKKLLQHHHHDVHQYRDTRPLDTPEATR